jgi:hypothetical protein
MKPPIFPSRFIVWLRKALSNMRRVADLANPRVVVGVDGVDGLAGPREPGAMTTSVQP